MCAFRVFWDNTIKMLLSLPQFWMFWMVYKDFEAIIENNCFSPKGFKMSLLWIFYRELSEIVSEYDQEIPPLQTADKSQGC